MFRPFVSEVILAKVKSSDEDGIRRMLVWLPIVSYLIFVPRSFGWVLRRYVHSINLPPRTVRLVRLSFYYQLSLS